MFFSLRLLSKTWITNFQLNIFILIEVSIRVVAVFFSPIECPVNIAPEVAHQFHSILDFDSLNEISLPRDEAYREQSFGIGCNDKINFKDKFVESIFQLPGTTVKDTEAMDQDPCSSSPSSEDDRVLLAHPRNCSLFYKCDWNQAVVFECPEDLHFNHHLQTCDWPWQAGCDDTWTRCPRPGPLCPAQHPRPVYLPHPRVCDKFYQCSWGQAYLQNCPTGLHFNLHLKVCDWPHNAKCHVC